jgi:NAD(P)-dependent dehydrogenase (short-subunit alcohol dehydrogenase family)
MSEVAIVTGGASGLGLSIVKRFAQKGMSVAIVDVSEETGREQEKILLAQGFRVSFFQADVTKQEETKRVVSQVVEEFESVSILVNAAGIIRRTPHVDVTDQELSTILDVNLKGTVFMCQAVSGFIKKNGGGAIVNFASMLAHYGSKNLLAYAASKGGIVQVTKCLAVDWASDHIRVNAVSPGYIETPLSEGATKDPLFNERILSRTPQRRYGKPEEVASVVDFLCSQDATFVTGVILPIDGGLLAGDPSLFPPA